MAAVVGWFSDQTRTAGNKPSIRARFHSRSGWATGTTVCAQVAAAESKATHARMADFLARFAPAMGSFQVHANLPARADTHVCIARTCARANRRAIACERRMDCATAGVLGGGRRLERVLVGLRPTALVSVGHAVVVLAATYNAARNMHCSAQHMMQRATYTAARKMHATYATCRVAPQELAAFRVEPRHSPAQ